MQLRFLCLSGSNHSLLQTNPRYDFVRVPKCAGRHGVRGSWYARLCVVTAVGICVVTAMELHGSSRKLLRGRSGVGLPKAWECNRVGLQVDVCVCVRARVCVLERVVIF